MGQPWPKGIHPEYTAFSMEVHVHQTKDGHLKSCKTISEEDQRIAMTLGASHGMEEGSWALLMEALRSEILLQVLVGLSNDETFKKEMKDNRKDLIEKVTNNTKTQINKSMEAVLPALIEEALQAIERE